MSHQQIGFAFTILELAPGNHGEGLQVTPILVQNHGVSMGNTTLTKSPQLFEVVLYIIREDKWLFGRRQPRIIGLQPQTGDGLPVSEGDIYTLARGKDHNPAVHLIRRTGVVFGERLQTIVEQIGLEVLLGQQP